MQTDIPLAIISGADATGVRGSSEAGTQKGYFPIALSGSMSHLWGGIAIGKYNKRIDRRKKTVISKQTDGMSISYVQAHRLSSWEQSTRP